MTQLRITQPAHDMFSRPDAPPSLKVGLVMLDELITLTMEHHPELAGKLAETIVTKRNICHSVIAAAVAVLAQAEISLRESAKTIETMIGDDPETLDKIKQTIATQYGIPVEDVKTQ